MEYCIKFRKGSHPVATNQGVASSNLAGRAKNQLLKAGLCRLYFLLQEFARLLHPFRLRRHAQKRNCRRFQAAIDLIHRSDQLSQLCSAGGAAACAAVHA